MRTYPFAINKCSFCKQLLQLKFLTSSICLSSSAVVVEGSHEQSVTLFTWIQLVKYICQKANLTNLLAFELLTIFFAARGIEVLVVQIEVLSLIRSVSSIRYLLNYLSFVIIYLTVNGKSNKLSCLKIDDFTSRRSY